VSLSIEQLKFARDFDFLDELFKQGSDGEAQTAVRSPELKLDPPDRGK